MTLSLTPEAAALTASAPSLTALAAPETTFVNLLHQDGTALITEPTDPQKLVHPFPPLFLHPEDDSSLLLGVHDPLGLPQEELSLPHESDEGDDDPHPEDLVEMSPYPFKQLAKSPPHPADLPRDPPPPYLLVEFSSSD